jgi:Protein of unknown function (DUF736)
LTIVPVDKTSDNGPDYRVYAGQRYEIGAGWSQVARSSGETYVNLKVATPEFGANWLRWRLVKSSSNTRPRMAPPTSCCGKATADGDAPPWATAAGLLFRYARLTFARYQPTRQTPPRAGCGVCGYVYFKEVRWTEWLT